MKIYVSDLDYKATEADLRKRFEKYGRVDSAKINLHRSGKHKGKSDGSGIVEMPNEQEGKNAIKASNGQKMMRMRLTVTSDPPDAQKRHSQQSKGSNSTSPEQSSASAENRHFHNPYTFVPTPPRPIKDKFAGDFNPLDQGLDHASLKDGLWTGHIPIKLTTVTPLVLPKTGGEERDSKEHQTYDVLDYIPESSLRGMLRSAYEVVTNSRYGCFKNSDRLAYRMKTDEALKLIPAIIEDGNEREELEARFCTGSSVPTDKCPKKGGTPQEGAMYAAMLTLYPKPQNKNLKTICTSNYIPKTGNEVWAEVVLCQHESSKRDTTNWSNDYLFWKVIAVWPKKVNCGSPRPTGEKPWNSVKPQGIQGKRQSHYAPVCPENRRIVEGHVLITNKNMGNKHDERIFFNLTPTIPRIFDITENLKNEGHIPETGHEAWAEILLCQKEMSPEGETDWSEEELVWKVIKVWQKSTESCEPDPTGKKPCDSDKPKACSDESQSYYAPITPEDRRVVEGYITHNGHGTPIYFNPKFVKVTKALREAWRMRIKSYREAHTESEIFGRPGARDEPWKYIDYAPGKTAWSPHQYQDSEHRSVWKNDPHKRATEHDAIELKHGDMVYAHCKFQKGKIVGIEDLFPVMISRELYEASPEELRDESLRPARTICQLSPADRLFGWVSQKEAREEQNEDPNIPKSYKSRVRVVCDDAPRPEIMQRFDGGGALPLTILGQPKPAQGRFYVAKNGEAQDGKGKRAAGYEVDNKKTKSLRGRKQYWHHKGLETELSEDKQDQCYWEPSVKDRTFKKRKERYQEYRRPDILDKQDGRYKSQTDSQNRSITGWIAPGVEFKASLYVQNLQPEEIGALLWLLTLNDKINDSGEKHYFRLGYGKPLGFGSVKMEIDQERLSNGCLPLGKSDDWKTYYKTLFGAPSYATLDKCKQEEYIEKFKESIEKAYKKSSELDVPRDEGQEPKKRQLAASENVTMVEKQGFDELPFISGFLRILQGPGDNTPIHYPRLKDEEGEYKPNPEGKNFEWFRKNEDNKKHALPLVTKEDKGLPYDPT